MHFPTVITSVVYSSTMKMYKILFSIAFTYAISCTTLQGNCVLPVKISPAVVDGAGNGVCPLQSGIDAQLNATKEEIRQAVLDTINPILNQNSASSRQCGGTGWTRVAFLNMTNPSEVCPSSLLLHNSPVRGCGRLSTGTFSCDSVTFPVNTQNYSGVCGRILAYQRGSTDAFLNSVFHGRNTTDSVYLDGVSLTNGPAGSRQHIWSFASALYEQDPNYITRLNCACTNTQYNWPYQLPSFIGNDYFCDTGNAGPGFDLRAYYSSDPLWDGEGCGSNSTCCQLNNPPWFQRALPQATSEDIELRLCHGESSLDNEDTIIFLIEIYVR